MTRSPILQSPSKDYPETIDNRAVLECLETLQEKLSAQEVAEYTAPLDNREALQKLELEKDELSALIASIGFSSLVAGLATFSIAWLGLLLAWKPMVRLEKVARLIELMKLILENFEEMGVEMLPLQKIPKAEPVDLFIRFPGKEFILFAIRSHANDTVIYNESRDAFRIKRQRSEGIGRRPGLSRWKPDPLTDLGEQEFWFRKNCRNFFGGNARATRRPIAKVLIVWNPTQLGEHQEHLYQTMGEQKFLFIPRKQGGAFYVITKNQVTDFIRAYLAHRQSQEGNS
ncbi:MAG: hypothetical protein LRZ84_16475 [Desertifilum sp.]|nr:hypothetical protein [Desertifilum sp.]